MDHFKRLKKKVVKIAALLTCHNRKNETIRCLRTLLDSWLPDDVELDVFLVDAGSTDCTSETVHGMFPGINIIQGTSGLYWSGGMRLAWETATPGEYDFYLWLNADTTLNPEALQVLLQTHSDVSIGDQRHAIIVGSVCDHNSGALTYGGVEIAGGRFGFLRFKPVPPKLDTPVLCDTFNGNVVLVPHEVTLLLGSISAEFTHGIGDYDYGLRAKKQNVKAWVASGYLGKCKRNEFHRSLRDSSLSVQERLAKMSLPTALPPAKEWMIFTRRHAGWLWPIYWARTSIRVAIPRLWIWLRSKKM